jgi:hypothetical protein
VGGAGFTWDILYLQYEQYTLPYPIPSVSSSNPLAFASNDSRMHTFAMTRVSCSAIPEIFRLLSNPKVDGRVHKSTPILRPGQHFCNFLSPSAQPPCWWTSPCQLSATLKYLRMIYWHGRIFLFRKCLWCFYTTRLSGVFAHHTHVCHSGTINNMTSLWAPSIRELSN